MEVAVQSRMSSSSSVSTGSVPAVPLCASCDRCRARKTKCDGNRPCGNCAAKYMKKNKLASVEGVRPEEFECFYSPAKRRGPVPGKAQSNTRKASSISNGTAQNRYGLAGRSDASSNSHYGAGGSSPMSESLKGSLSPASAAQLYLSGNNQNLYCGNVNEASNQHDIMQQLQAQQNNIDEMAAMQSAAYGMGNQSNSMFSSGMLPIPGIRNDDMMALLQQQQQQHQLSRRQHSQQQEQRQQLQLFGNTAKGSGHGNGGILGATVNGGGARNGLNDVHAAQLNYLQHQLQQQNSGGASAYSDLMGSNGSATSSLGLGSLDSPYNKISSLEQRLQAQSIISEELEDGEQRRFRLRKSGPNGDRPVVKSNEAHLDLIDRTSVDGNRLHSFFDLSINELLNLPPVPTNDDYLRRLSNSRVNSTKKIPKFDIAALNAARFAEIALGALVNHQVSLAVELSSATAACLRECVEEPVHPTCMYDVARAYFLHGMFRSYRGDMERYFKYRRICLTLLHQIRDGKGVQELLAGISFHDSWAYIVHNADISTLPNIDDAIPPLPCSEEKHGEIEADLKEGLADGDLATITSNPYNQMWIQGPPPIFINNEAPHLSRSLDALACAVRSCCDQANRTFESMAKAMNNGEDPSKKDQPDQSSATPTASAVLANEKELCSRNMVRSAFTFLQSHELKSDHTNLYVGHHMIISAMDAFLENNGEEGGAFTEQQVESLLKACNTVVQHPYILYQPGPIYHMMCNATILLIHLLNGMHANILAAHNDEASSTNSKERLESEIKTHNMELALFEETFDTFMSSRKVLAAHRKKLPVRLRCHGIPRPNVVAATTMGANVSSLNSLSSNPNGGSFIDLSETQLCACRGCQGFVLMACSPCVAAERAQAARARYERDLELEDGARNITNGLVEEETDDKEFGDLGAEFGLDDDDALLSVLSRIIKS